jgi:hypothetical protein
MVFHRVVEILSELWSQHDSASQNHNDTKFNRPRQKKNKVHVATPVNVAAGARCRGMLSWWTCSSDMQVSQKTRWLALNLQIYSSWSQEHASANFSIKFQYCILARWGTGALRPRDGCARDLVNFREKKLCIARSLRARAGSAVYLPWIQIWDDADSIARRDNQKSKFGLRHVV